VKLANRLRRLSTFTSCPYSHCVLNGRSRYRETSRALSHCDERVHWALASAEAAPLRGALRQTGARGAPTRRAPLIARASPCCIRSRLLMSNAPRRFRATNRGGAQSTLGGSATRRTFPSARTRSHRVCQLARNVEAELAMNEAIKTLKTSRHLRVPVLTEDEEIIKAKAKAVGLSTAAYLRGLGLGFEPPSTLDYRAVTELAKINGDQGRLGGLLKLWLTDDAKFREFVKPRDARSAVLTLLQQLGESQQRLQSVMRRIVDGS
jgi:hypothetical protein